MRAWKQRANSVIFVAEKNVSVMTINRKLEMASNLNMITNTKRAICAYSNNVLFVPFTGGFCKRNTASSKTIASMICAS